jgi:hypothetical protein
LAQQPIGILAPIYGRQACTSDRICTSHYREGITRQLRPLSPVMTNHTRPRPRARSAALTPHSSWARSQPTDARPLRSHVTKPADTYTTPVVSDGKNHRRQQQKPIAPTSKTHPLFYSVVNTFEQPDSDNREPDSSLSLLLRYAHPDYVRSPGLTL